ncbi:DUF6932 family protein [Sorangium cellulosum]|uniref:DUF6932 family protein n=1 Tax=Sorangium cellulosum TaxID=56 RepID=UPI0012DB1B49|nr:hypothetical protein [Sorangium cellulosum]
MNETAGGDFWETWSCSLSIAPSMAPIPDHQPNGLLPPFLGPDPTTRALMSPHMATPEEFVAKFATSEARRRILTGYLNHREAIRRTGLTTGFQWLAGSFADRMTREPNDIDIVTFFVSPNGWDQSAVVHANPTVFRPHLSKVKYQCDAYFVSLSAWPRVNASRLLSDHGFGAWARRYTISGGAPKHRRRRHAHRRRAEAPSQDDPEFLVKISAYWFGLFSHQKLTFWWRGIVCVPLASHDNDAAARDMLQLMAEQT